MSSYPTATLDADHPPDPSVLGQGMTPATATAVSDGYNTYSAALMTLSVTVAGNLATAQLINVGTLVSSLSKPPPPPIEAPLTITWGDGSSDPMDLNGTDPTQSVPTTHTYTADGVFHAQAYADTSDGVQRAMAEVYVNWPSPT